MTGDTKESQIQSHIQKFQTDDSCKIFLGTWQKAGTGITLTAASYMIFIDTPWTWGDFEQAQDRIHRIGTKNSVIIYNLIAKDTIDEHVRELVYKKRAFSRFMIDDDVRGDIL